jgi:Na+/H+ antiporter NhaD/arsenite permease-like protein
LAPSGGQQIPGKHETPDKVGRGEGTPRSRGHARLQVKATRETAWLALAMSSTFAGNLTVLGSVANLIVVESARREGVTISFWEYCKVGIPLTILTLVLGIAWLQFVRY